MQTQGISAVTFFVRSMATSVDFYERCGFVVTSGGADAEFTTLQAGDAFVNLIDNGNYAPTHWGRVIFRVASADEQYNHLISSGITPDAPPKDAAWGERYFHVADPDGHELSFAELL